MRTSIVPVILAGGSGERLWPLSKLDFPKQFVTLEADGHSLFQQTILRVRDRSRFTAPVIVCNHVHRFIVSEQLRVIGVEDATLIVEPAARNTAPALAFAALHCLQSYTASPMLVLPSDHHIDDEAAFHTAVQQAAPAAEAGHVVTFAITPHAPETGYGYIESGPALDGHDGLHRLSRFVEKPMRELAETYIATGRYGWNSGIFVLSACTALDELQRFAPAILDCCTAAYDAHIRDGSFLRPAEHIMELCPSDSIDYALMEHTDRGAVLPVAMGWCDLGSWKAMADRSPADAQGNSTQGRVMMQDTEHCYIRTDSNMLVATLGVRDLVIVAADDALLVGHKEQMQNVKSLLGQMRGKYVPDTHLMSFAHRPWGSFYHIDSGAQYQVKKLHLIPGGKISLQSHTHRSEHWVVVAGRATVTTDGVTRSLEASQSTYIPAGSVHRLENREETDLIVIEVQTGDYLGEDDIERLEDDYNRADA